jgi:putative endonuclease
LLYYEDYQWLHDAIAREKQIKAGSRQRKTDLISSCNPSWDDLRIDWFTEEDISAFKLV